MPEQASDARVLLFVSAVVRAFEMKVVNGYLPALHPAQIKIAKDQSRYKCVAAGRRFGKGVLGMSAEFWRASRGKHCRWISPTYASDSYQSAWKMAKNFCEQIPGIEQHIQKREFDFSRIGGGWVQFRTAEEPDALRGEGIDFVLFDEAAHIANLEELWEQCVRPSLMDRAGEAWFITTPKGFNYFNVLYRKGDESEEWQSFQFPTEANPHIRKEEIDELRASLPILVARQEIDAEFVQLAGALFKRENIKIIDCEPAGVSWVRSWDLAFTEKTTSDFTAGVKMGMTRDGTVVISDVAHGRYEWPDAVRCISNTAHMDGAACRQGVEVVGAQVGASQELLRDPLLLEHTIIPITVTKDKLTRALPLVARSEQGKLAIVRASWNAKLIDEFCSFPEGMHDDIVDGASGGMTLLASGYGPVEVDTFDKSTRQGWGYESIERRRAVLI